MKVVDGEGELRQLPPESLPPGVTMNSDQILKAAQVNLGLFGVAVEYTVTVKPMSNCRVQNIFDQTLQVIIILI